MSSHRRTRVAKQVTESDEIVYGSTDSILKLVDCVRENNSSTTQLTGYRLRQKRPSRPESPLTDSSESDSTSTSMATLENKRGKRSRQNTETTPIGEL